MKNYLIIQITNTGAAFDNPTAETARILRQLADQIEAGNPPEKLRDINGNRCGEVTHHPDFFVTEE